MVAFATMRKARVITTVSVKPGRFSSIRTLCRRSCQKVSIIFTIRWPAATLLDVDAHDLIVSRGGCPLRFEGPASYTFQTSSVGVLGSSDSLPSQCLTDHSPCGIDLFKHRVPVI